MSTDEGPSIEEQRHRRIKIFAALERIKAGQPDDGDTDLVYEYARECIDAESAND